MKHRPAIAALLTISLIGCASTPKAVIDRQLDPHPWTHLDFRDDPDNFQFAIVGDLTGGYRKGVFDKAVKMLNLLQPEFVMSVGDLVDGLTDKGVSSDWELFDGWVDQLEMPFFYVMGNHDVAPGQWSKRLGPTYYHFLYKDVLFLILNTEDHGDKGLTEEQVAYARDVLARYGESRWTFVFLHKAIWHEVYLKEVLPPRPTTPAMVAQWQKIEDALGQRPYTVFSGDWHRYTRFDRQGRDYIILGTTGGGLGWDGKGPDHVGGPARGEFDHIVWVTMTDDGPRIAPLNLHGLYDKNIHVGTIDLLGASTWEYSTDDGKSFLADPVTVKPGETKAIVARCEFLVNTERVLKDYASLKLSHNLSSAWQARLTLNGHELEGNLDRMSGQPVCGAEPGQLKLGVNELRAGFTVNNTGSGDLTVLPKAQLEPLWPGNFWADVTVGPYVQNPSPTAITIQWESNAESEATVVCVPDRTDAKPISAVGRVHEKMVFPVNPDDKESGSASSWLYRARLTGLTPDTQYTYTVRMNGSDEASGSFRTWAEEPESVTFIAYGDTRSNPYNHRFVARQFGRHDPAFILHSGDLVEAGSVFAQWAFQFFTPLNDVIDGVPLFPALGNHEHGAPNLLRLFDVPDGRTWFSFTHGPVHVVVLDYSQQGPEVLEWLKTDLAASKAPWKICMYHVPSFNFGGHQSDTARTTFLPIMEEYGVDFVLAGHSHQYERFVPMRRTGNDHLNPMTFITTGGGGAPLYGISVHRLHAKMAQKLHYCVFTADGQTLTVQVLGAGGEQIDAFAVSKKNGRYDDTYLSGTQPMEAAILAQGLLKTAPPVADAVPTEQQAAAVAVDAHFPGLARPGSLTVELAEESRKHYESEPLIVDIAQGKTTAVLSVKALSRITAEKRGKSTVLSPPLRLLLTARSDGVEEPFKTAEVMLRQDK